VDALLQEDGVKRRWMNSSHKCNSLGIKKDLERCSVIQSLARPIVELSNDLLNKYIADNMEVTSFGEISSQ
jgi:hypothetical protein